MSQNPESLSDRPNTVGWRADGSDVLTSVMDAVRLRGQVFCRSELRAPWGMALMRSDYAHFHVIERGGAWLRIGGRPAVALAAGDLVVVPHGAGHTLTDSLASKARPLSEMAGRGSSEGGCLVMRGGGEGAETRLVCGSFRFERKDAHPLVELLPPLIHLRPAEAPAAEWLEATLRFLAWETRQARPGTETIVSRLTDVVFVQVLRAWIEALPEGQGGWMGALRDRQVGAALALVHRSPERDFTIASLAAAVGMSRSRFAARFTALVGEPPLAYVARWRLETAAGLLRESSLSLGEVAERVGYDSEAAFSKAFRRRFGAPPGAYRRSRAA
jgi:AraC-like DNA-binding protein